VEDHKALKTSTIIRELADPVKNEVNDFLADSVVATGVIISSVLLARDELLRVVELAVGSGANLVANRRLKVDKDGSRNMLSSTSLGEKGVERVITAADGFIRGHLTIGLDTVLKAVKLPAGITSLDSGLAKVD